MAYYIDNKEIVESVDINYILNYFKNKGETCIRIMHARSFPLLGSERVEKIENSIIIEPIGDKSSYVYQDGSRTVSIDRERGSICINPYFDKSGIYDNDHSLCKDLNILPNEYGQAFPISNLYNAKFIQLDYISGTYGKSKLNESNYLTYRDKYPNISVFGGVWPKYYVPSTGSDLTMDLKNAMNLCDAIVVTGSGTGKETPLDKIKLFRDTIGDFPLIIGAGLTAENIHQMEYADGAIVGSYFKPNGTADMVDVKLVSNFMKNLK